MSDRHVRHVKTKREQGTGVGFRVCYKQWDFYYTLQAWKGVGIVTSYNQVAFDFRRYWSVRCEVPLFLNILLFFCSLQ